MKKIAIFLCFLFICVGCTKPNEIEVEVTGIDVNTLTVAEVADQKYTGGFITPKLTVMTDDKILIERIDYTLSYQDNTNVGVSTIIIKGKGEYSGTKLVNFNIVNGTPKAKITCVNKVYNGLSQVFAACSGGGISNNVRTNAGTYVVTCKGDSTHSNATSKKCKIEKASIANATVSKIANQRYTGKSITPVITITMGDKKLVKGTDYTLSYKNNVSVGTATIVVTGRGNYIGTTQTTFQITGSNEKSQAIITCNNKAYNGTDQVIATCSGGTISGATQKEVGTYTITCKGDSNHTDAPSEKCSIKKPNINVATIGNIADQKYTGKAITPNPAVKIGSIVLTKDKDYTLSYKNNVNAGTATIVVTGIGNYEGVKSATFKITKPEEPIPVSTKLVTNTYDYTYANLNVLDFGADKTGAKDSTSAFKQAIAKASQCKNGGCGSSGGGTIYVPAGKYKITEQLDLPDRVALIGTLKEGTATGTVLYLYYGKGTTDVSKAAIKVNTQAAVKNMAFYYPEQSINSSSAIQYPPTIIQTGVESLTLENLMFVNSYIAIDLKSHHYNNAIQFIKDIYGTPLKTGLINDTNLDTIKIENLRFAPTYWLNSGLNAPSSSTLSSLLKSSAVALIMERVDWFFLSNITVTGYQTGLLLRSSSEGSSEGEMFDATIKECTYPVRIQNSQHIVITGSTLHSSGGASIRIESGAKTDLSINSCNLKGNESIHNGGTGNISVTSSTLNGKIVKSNKIALAGNSLTNTGYENINVSTNNVPASIPNYKKKVTTKPASEVTKEIKGAVGSDITSELQSAINSLTSGGLVYIPAGRYKITGPITIKSGVEVRGSVPWPHHSGGTTIETSYYKGPIFILAAKAGLNGLTIEYPFMANPYSSSSKNYVIQGRGSNVYIMNIAIRNAWSGIDLASYNCSNHYVRGIWGSFLEHGISVGGGSSNGIVRECHFTTNLLPRTPATNFKNNYRYTLEHETAFAVGNTTNQVVFNTFVWGSATGYDVKNASNASLIGCGADYANKGLRISGTVNNGQFINMLLVTKPVQTIQVSGMEITLDVNTVHVANNRYIEIDENHQGYVNILNPIVWGNANSPAFQIKGKGDTHINGGILENSNPPVIINGAVALSTYGLMINQATSIELDNVSGSKNTNHVCPIPKDGTFNVQNTAGIPSGLNMACLN